MREEESGGRRRRTAGPASSADEAHDVGQHGLEDLARMNSELPVDFGAVALHGALRDAELGGDARVAAAERDEFEQMSFPVAQGLGARLEELGREAFAARLRLWIAVSRSPWPVRKMTGSSIPRSSIAC